MMSAAKGKRSARRVVVGTTIDQLSDESSWPLLAALVCYWLILTVGLLWAALERFGYTLGSLLAALGTLSHTLGLVLAAIGPLVGHQRAAIGCSCLLLASLGRVWVLLGVLGPLLECSWPHGRCLAALGALFGALALGALCGDLGPLFGCRVAQALVGMPLLGLNWLPLGRSWAALGALLIHSWTLLGRSWPKSRPGSSGHTILR